MLMTMKILRFLATSIAFSLMAAAITLVMWALSVAGYELVPGHQVQNWLAQGIMTVAYGSLAGLLVDAARMLAAIMALAWQPIHGRDSRTWREKNGADACLAD